jgi:hypothetical protein
MLKHALAISAALLLFGSNAMAQGAARACAADGKKLCADVQPGGPHRGLLQGALQRPLATVSEFVGGDRRGRENVHG